MHVAYLDLNKGFNTISQSIFLEELMAAHDLEGCTVGDGRQMSTKNSRKKNLGSSFFFCSFLDSFIHFAGFGIPDNFLI